MLDARQLPHRGDLGGLKGRAIVCSEVRHEDERVVVSPLLLAHRLELAEVAMRTWLRASVGNWAGRKCGVELPPKPAPVCVDASQAHRLPSPRAEGHMDIDGPVTGLFLDGVGVEAELENVPRLRFVACKLRVNWFVRRGASAVVNAFEEVGDTAHAVVDERHLKHEIVAGGEHAVALPDPGLE
jgi:hypothetical protein